MEGVTAEQLARAQMSDTIRGEWDSTLIFAKRLAATNEWNRCDFLSLQMFFLREVYITLRCSYLDTSRPRLVMSAFQRGGSSSKTYVSGNVKTPLPPIPRNFFTLS